jgi:hypothetical protein
VIQQTGFLILKNGKNPTSSAMPIILPVALVICVVILVAYGMNQPHKRKKLVNVRSFMKKVDYITLTGLYSSVNIQHYIMNTVDKITYNENMEIYKCQTLLH